MKLFPVRSGKKLGSPPGVIIHVGEDRTEPVRISRLCYDESGFTDEQDISLPELLENENHHRVEWIQFDGTHNVELIARIGARYSIDSMVLEDIANSYERAKCDDYGDYIYIVMKILTFNETKGDIEKEQVNIVFNDKTVISFQEKRSNAFEHIISRIRNPKGAIRREGADYLAYSIMDGIIDHYFVVLEKTGSLIEQLEEELLYMPGRRTMAKLHRLKRDMLAVRKTVWPLREMISQLMRSENTLMRKGTMPYMRDLYDHTIEAIDTVEIYREFLSSMTDIYLSSVSNKMNEIIKVLTLISTIFIPLTFIAGVYGMNFANMPETRFRYGYFICLAVMGVVAGGMVVFFKRKKWL